MNKYLNIIYLHLILVLTYNSYGADFESARSSALGGASLAGPQLNDAIYMNPSFASFSESYALSSHYQFYDGPGVNGFNNTKGKVLNISVLDGRTESFQAGVGYTRRDNSTWIHAGASKSFLPRISAGIGAKFFFGSTVLPSGHEGSASFSYLPTDWLQTGFVVDNLLQTNATQAWNLPRKISIGTKWNIEKIILLYVDAHYTPSATGSTKAGFNSGAEFPIFSDLFLRTGYFRNSQIAQINTTGNGFALGAGWLAPRFSLDYGYSKTTQPRENILHNMGMTVFF